MGAGGGCGGCWHFRQNWHYVNPRLDQKFSARIATRQSTASALSLHQMQYNFKLNLMLILFSIPHLTQRSIIPNQSVRPLIALWCYIRLWRFITSWICSKKGSTENRIKNCQTEHSVGLYWFMRYLMQSMKLPGRCHCWEAAVYLTVTFTAGFILKEKVRQFFHRPWTFKVSTGNFHWKAPKCVKNQDKGPKIQ